MLAEEPTSTAAVVDTPDDVDAAPAADVDAPVDAPAPENPSPQTEKETELSKKILKANELYTRGSRNYLVKSYAKAADDLSQVCSLFGELHGELADELGLPYLFYGKSLVALALDENKVIDVPDQEEDDDDDEEDYDYSEEKGNQEYDPESPNAVEKSKTDSTKKDSIKEDEGPDSTETLAAAEEKEKPVENVEAVPLKTDNNASNTDKKIDGCEEKSDVLNDGEKPSTSNGDAKEGTAAEEDDETDVGSSLQLAWEILELAAKIFERQGERGCSNLAEVHAELGNIQFENNQLEAARGDYEKVINIYKALPSKYRRAMAEIHYKIGLTYLMQQLHQESAAALKEACNLIAEEIKDIESKLDPTDKDKSNIQDMEETKHELEAKIMEIEETQALNVAEVRAALDNYIKPVGSGDADAGPSTASDSASDGTSPLVISSGYSLATPSALKPNDITHLIKRKISKDCSSEAESVACSPAKRPAV